MALGLFNALKIIPWRDVVAAAPTVVRGARELWSKVRHDDAPPVPEAAAPPAAAPAHGELPHAVAALEGRVRALESQLAAHAREAVSASELIATLAEQNARLVETVERLRLRTQWLLAGAGVLAVGLAVALVGTFGGR